MYDLRKTSLIVLADIGDLRVVSGARWHIHSVEMARTFEAVMTGIRGSTLAKRAVSNGGRLERKDILEYVQWAEKTAVDNELTVKELARVCALRGIVRFDGFVRRKLQRSIEAIVNEVAVLFNPSWL